ncbi:MAG: amidase [Deltaproteobacteria bacterium]|nr:amidase [Deltaproteobacteria bacterium]
MSYERKPLKSPRLAGTAFRAAIAALESPIGNALRDKTLNDQGFAELRREAIDAPIAPVPVLPIGTWTGTAPSLDAIVERADRGPGFAFETVADFRQAYREGRTDPVQVAERLATVIGELDRHDPPMRFLIAHQRDDLLRQAKEAKARLDRRAPLSPLDGVPVAIKDEVDMVPYPTTAGTKVHGGTPATSDASSVARLRAAGALLFGKTNMPEIGLTPEGMNPHHGPCRNPYHPGHDTGGSSSGSAASVAAGLAPLALGADGGGSIRIPASHCGVVGLKPTFGRVSEHGAAPLCWSVGHIGPIGATVADTALGYAVMAGRDPRDANTLRQPDVVVDDLRELSLKGARVGVWTPWFDDADPSVVKACRAALGMLVEAGATTVEFEAPELQRMQNAHLVTIASEMLAGQRATLAHRRRDYSLSVRLILALAERFSAADYVHAQRLRGLFTERFAAIYDKVDVIATPTCALTAQPYAKDALPYGVSDLPTLDKTMRYVRLGNFLGLPSISVPAGYDEGGMPIGLMLTGRAWQEALLLRLAHVVERRVERRAPTFHRRLLPA